MDESARQLDKPFEKEAVCITPLGEPQVFQHIMSFVEELPVEAIEITDVMGIQIPSTVLLDGSGYSRAFATHTVECKA